MNDYQFSIPKTRLIVMALCLISTQLMFYAAGVATGFLASNPRSADRLILAKAPAQPAAPKLPDVKKELAKLEPVRMETAKPAVGGNPVTATESSGIKMTGTAASTSTPSTPSAGDAAAKPASSLPAATDDEDTQVLAIQVASFQTEDRASELAELLRRNNFGPVTVGHMDRDDQTWHYVRLGPYRDWDAASRISAEVDRSYNLHSFIRLVRTSSN
ncbi:MAG TPA: SPOR domain-containing protein [Bryobacteraceae bacterium]|nr:SPOR domain-containing protein [Bryobacteraceae bacterium]